MFGKKFCLGDYYPEDQEIIYRYIPFWKFMHIVFQRKFYLSRGDQFNDPLEGKETKLSRNIRATVHNDEAFASNSAYYDKNRICVAINCWYAGDTESLEMWENFAPSPDGIAIRSTIHKLKKALSKDKNKLCIRKVEYVENHDVEFTKFGCPFYPFSIKISRDFKLESEIRVIYGDGKACMDESPLYNASVLDEVGVELNVDPSILIDTVILSPKAPDWFLNSIQTIISCLKIDLKVKNSELNVRHTYSF